ncbi:MAG: Rieske 2Fe-2S domain-containing protein [Lautropia sp.]
MSDAILRGPFQGYHAPRGLREDAELTHVDRGSPAGEYLRRFWQPIAFVQELTDLPLKVRILGEDLVLYRDGGGRIGLLDLHCSHRGASLEYAVIGEHGLRCMYHGWRYDADGTILQTPAGAPESHECRLHHGAYPVHVFQDLVFAYLGPPEKKPQFPSFDAARMPWVSVEPGLERTAIMECNWLQIQENGMDPVHTAFVHVLVSGTQRGFSDQMGVLPDIQFAASETGTYYIATRRVGDNVWVRIVDAMLGNVNLVPPDDQRGTKAGVSQGPFIIIWAVPMDNHTTKRFYLLLDDSRLPLKAYQRARAFGQANDRPYAERQRHPGDYEAQVGQGAIAIHARENLTPSDDGVRLLREVLRREIRAVAGGSDPSGVHRDLSQPIRTRTQNTVVFAPMAGSKEADRERRMAIGRQVADADYREQWPPC